MRSFPKPSDWPLTARLLLLGALYLAITIVALLPAAQPPARGGFDHYLHTIVFGGLTIATYAAFPQAWKAASIVFVTSVLIEVGQMFVPERSASLGDVTANAMGVSIALLAILWWSKKSGRSKRDQGRAA